MDICVNYPYLSQPLDPFGVWRPNGDPTFATQRLVGSHILCDEKWVVVTGRRWSWVVLAKLWTQNLGTQGPETPSSFATPQRLVRETHETTGCGDNPSSKCRITQDVYSMDVCFYMLMLWYFIDLSHFYGYMIYDHDHTCVCVCVLEWVLLYFYVLMFADRSKVRHLLYSFASLQISQAVIEIASWNSLKILHEGLHLYGLLCMVWSKSFGSFAELWWQSCGHQTAVEIHMLSAGACSASRGEGRLLRVV